MKKKLLISFSAGRTSAYMTWWLLNEWGQMDDYDIQVVFANTSKEHEGTLRFARDCEINFGVNIVWVEAIPVQSERGGWWGVSHRIVTFETAKRKGEVFEEMISKLGIPSTEAPFCSDQLKRKAIESYLKSIGWGTDFYKAIGIRADEIDRMNENWRANKIIYPLVKYNPVNKKMVNDWWKNQSFDLNIPFDLGNCDGCWKKPLKKLVRIAQRHPEVFDWWQEMTDKYGHIQTRKGQKNMEPPFNFYRGNLSPKDIFVLAAFDKRQLRMFAEEEKLDGCSESCEAY